MLPKGPAIVIAVLALCAAAASAGTARTWDGGAGTSNWFDPDNWDPCGPPAPQDALNVTAGSPAAGNWVYTSNGGSITIQGPTTSATFNGWFDTGYEGIGSLTILGGADVASGFSYVGLAADSNGTVTIEGDGSSWNTNAQDLYVGGSGSGRVSVSAGSGLFTGTGMIGCLSGSSGRVSIDGASAMWSSGGSLYVGGDNTAAGGLGVLSVGGGGQVVVAGSLTVWPTGTVQLGKAIVVADELNFAGGGAGAILSTNESELRVNALIGAPSSMSFDGSLVIGHNSGSGTGSHSLDTGQSLQVGETLLVGRLAEGSLAVGGGAGVSCYSALLGWGSDSNAAVSVAGAGTLWSNTADLYVGGGLFYDGESFLAAPGTGSLDISDRAVVSGGAAFLGRYAGSLGRVTVDDANWTNGGDLSVGPEGVGRLEIRNGAAVTNNFAYLGDASTGQGAVLVDDANWDSSGYLYVGRYGTGSLTIRNGAAVSSASAFLGRYPSGEGQVLVTGGTWTNTGLLYVGRSGHAGLAIEAGGAVTAEAAYIAYATGSQGTVDVAGAGASLTIANGLDVGGGDPGGGGTGSLTVAVGGTVSVGSTLKIWPGGTVTLDGGQIGLHDLNVAGGQFSFSSGALMFSGDVTADAAFAATILGPSHEIAALHHLGVAGTAALTTPLVLRGGTLSVGSLAGAEWFQFDIGTFNLTDANLAVAPGGLLGQNLTLDGLRHVSAANGTTIAPAGRLEMAGGSLGGGTLTNRGVLSGHGRIDAPLTNEAGGQVRATAGSALLLTAGGNANLGEIALLGGCVEFTADLTNAPGGLIYGQGTLIASGGLTNDGNMVLANAASLAGDANNRPGGHITISGLVGTTFFDDVHNDGEIKVLDGSCATFLGSFDGSSGTTGGGAVFFAGDLKPGHSPAAIGFGGDVAFAPGARLVVELGGTAAGSFDALAVHKTAELAGELALSLWNGFVPVRGDRFAILSADAVSGRFDTVTGFEVAPTTYLAVDYDANSVTVTATMPGDADIDGDVDYEDYKKVLQNFNQTASDKTWRQSDYDYDGDVDYEDYKKVLQNFGSTWSSGGQDPIAVPEPGTVLLLSLATVALLRRRRREKRGRGEKRGRST